MFIHQVSYLPLSVCLYSCWVRIWAGSSIRPSLARPRLQLVSDGRFCARRSRPTDTSPTRALAVTLVPLSLEQVYLGAEKVSLTPEGDARTRAVRGMNFRSALFCFVLLYSILIFTSRDVVFPLIGALGYLIVSWRVFLQTSIMNRHLPSVSHELCSNQHFLLEPITQDSELHRLANVFEFACWSGSCWTTLLFSLKQDSSPGVFSKNI